MWSIFGIDWDEAEAKQIGAMNLLIDAPSAQRSAEIQSLQKEVGECMSAGPVIPENWLRGQVNLTCAHGVVGAFFTLSPTEPPKIQHLSYRKIDIPRHPAGRPNSRACRRQLRKGSKRWR